MPELNSPMVVALVEAMHDAYERALAANDVEALSRFFWQSPEVVRFGVAEQLYGAEDLAAYRRRGSPVFTDRRMVRRKVLAIGANVASVMSEFEQRVSGRPRHSRQSQLWVEFEGSGWKIVAAHVSNALAASAEEGVWETYSERAASALFLPIDPAHLPGVAANLEQAAAIVAPLMRIALPAAAEAAPVFHP